MSLSFTLRKANLTAEVSFLSDFLNFVTEFYAPYLWQLLLCRKLRLSMYAYMNSVHSVVLAYTQHDASDWEQWLGKDVKMLQEWHWDRNRMWKIIFPCFFIFPSVVGLLYDAVLLLKFFSCLLFIRHYCCLNTLPQKSYCPSLSKRTSEIYGAKQNHA